MIEVKELSKQYQVKTRDPARGAISNFFSPVVKHIVAVDAVSFSVERGETVAFIGPNGAGKSTTIKMLTGILHPTSGTASVLGLSPQENRIEMVKRIGAVFGQRSQLAYNLPLTDTFALLARVYEIPPIKARAQAARLIEVFDLAAFVDHPVRQLSLGQRMRAEVAASLLHEPEIVFLDEPSIGLDVVAKRALRENLVQANKEYGTTIFLTSHDAGDVESVCARTIVVNHGSLVFDGATNDLKRQYLKRKVVTIVHAGGTERVEIDTEKTAIADVLSKVLREYAVEDIAVEGPPLEEVIREIYSHARAH